LVHIVRVEQRAPGSNQFSGCIRGIDAEATRNETARV
jgi:hypothetical protein